MPRKTFLRHEGYCEPIMFGNLCSKTEHVAPIYNHIQLSRQSSYSKGRLSSNKSIYSTHTQTQTHTHFTAERLDNLLVPASSITSYKECAFFSSTIKGVE